MQLTLASFYRGDVQMHISLAPEDILHEIFITKWISEDLSLQKGYFGGGEVASSWRNKPAAVGMICTRRDL